MCCRANIWVAVLGALVAGTVLFSNAVDGGIRRYWPRPSFGAADIPELHGKVFVVTGANAGIGRETALALAKKGATVVAGCRSPCKAVADAMGGRGVALALDLSDAKSISEFYDEFKRLNLPLHGLVLNAGVMTVPEFRTTADGLEMQTGVNWIGHFFLQKLLEKELVASAPSRVVIVSAKAHDVITSLPAANESVLDTPASRAAYHPVRNYALSKTLNILHARQLHKRLKDKNVCVLSLHPGVIQTDLARHLFEVAERYLGHTITQYIFDAAFKLFLTAHEGALTQLYAATSPEVLEKDLCGAYLRPLVRKTQVSRVAQDDANAERAWSDAEKIVQGFARRIHSPETAQQM